ncbi:MAG: divalent-cation tolerance protein CutA [Betaproteobacteria bacterium]|nr:divalent-cation tolerance protein CutA [Betaproteobacteria bacterium]
MNEAIVVLTNLPDQASAETLATLLVEARQAACVNILAPCRSVYRWKGQIERAEEVPLLIKTTRDRYAELEQAIRAHHPYEIPEIVALPIEAGSASYMNWIRAEVA